MKINFFIKKKINFIKRNYFFKKKLITFLNCKKWIFGSTIEHETAKFFKIAGFNIKTNYPKLKEYSQPLIIQNEIGYLVIFKYASKLKNFYLLQLKFEPGNQNYLQLSPAIQATKSNYTRVHNGKKTRFLKYLKNKKLIKLNSNQREQGTRYLNKLNKNMVIELNKKIKVPHNYVWLTKEDLIILAKINNFFNMDTLSIFSCFLKKQNEDYKINKDKVILNMYSKFKNKYYCKLKTISLFNMPGWNYTKTFISDYKEKLFKIISLKINTDTREVKEWCQPIVSDYFRPLNILFFKIENSVKFYLCNIIIEAGYKTPMFTCTLMKKNRTFSNSEKIMFDKSQYVIKKKIIDVINSDEGGRFLNNQSKNTVYEIKEKKNMQNKDYIWISYNQMIDLIIQKKISIELRNLFGIINLENLK